MPNKIKTADEKALEKDLCRKINAGSEALKNICVEEPSGERKFFLDLLCGQRPNFLDRTILEDTNDWTNGLALSDDLYGKLVPDIVLRSSLLLKNRTDHENRIIIEVKKDARFGHIEDHASQILRYFLYLLSTTSKCRKGCKPATPCPHDMQRAVLLAAPETWFQSKYAEPWDFFVKHYGPLAKQFDITIGRIVLSQT